MTNYLEISLDSPILPGALIQYLFGFKTGEPFFQNYSNKVMSHINSSVSDSRARGPGFDTWSGHILLFLLPLVQEGQFQILEKVCAGSTC